MDNSEHFDHKFVALAEIVRQWCVGACSPRGELVLGRTAALIAKRALGRKLHLCAERLDCSCESAALSAVSSLFCPKGQESLLSLSLQEKLDSDDVTLVRMFEDLARWTARQYPWKIGMAIDPERARLDRYIRKLIREREGCELFSACGRRWVAFAGRSAFTSESAPWCYEDLVHVLTAGSGQTSSVSRLFEYLASEVLSQSDRCPVAALSDIVDASRLFIPASTGDTEISNLGGSDVDPMMEIVVKRCQEHLQNETSELAGRYVKAGKLTSAEAQACVSATADLALEWLNDGFLNEHLGLYHYLAAHLPNLAESEFRNRLEDKFWRIQYEARSGLRICLKKNFGETLGK